ncbi:MFS transporter [Sphaerimonospora thailandensis]|uniref:MFS transporter n=1 Tax=Sphaerimonospora thailandensis TaxID=795644 RepID=A0A8J3W0I5_9ACTN|nr:MFS transporter [Sphaerimonospora thailandensis]GIH71210.1 MFS transporter [Sphaerimonospora thailandensis]
MSFVSDLRVLLEGRDFRRLFGTRLVSQFSDGIFQFAVAGYAFFSPEKQATAAEMAVAMAVLFLPYSVFGPFVGVLIDRWSRRQILVVAPLVRGTLLLLTAGLVALSVPDEAFYGAALAVLAVNRFFLAALGASLPHVVPPERLIMANAITPTSGTVLTAVGMGVAFLLRLIFGSGHGGTAALLVISGLSFGLSAIIAATMERSLLGPAYDAARPPAGEAVRIVLRGLADGARHVVRRRRAAATLGAMATYRLLFGMSLAMAVMLYRYYFTTDDVDAALKGITLVGAATGVGFFLAMPVTPWATDRFRIETWVPAMLTACAVVEFALFATFHEWAFIVAGLLLGVAGQSVKICADTVVQRDVDDAFLGRIFSIYDMLFNVTTVMGAALAAAMLPPDGRSYLALGVISVCYLLGALTYRLIVPAAAPASPPASPTERQTA